MVDNMDFDVDLSIETINELFNSLIEACEHDSRISKDLDSQLKPWIDKALKKRIFLDDTQRRYNNFINSSIMQQRKNSWFSEKTTKGRSSKSGKLTIIDHNATSKNIELVNAANTYKAILKDFLSIYTFIENFRKAVTGITTKYLITLKTGKDVEQTISILNLNWDELKNSVSLALTKETNGEARLKLQITENDRLEKLLQEKRNDITRGLQLITDELNKLLMDGGAIHQLRERINQEKENQYNTEMEIYNKNGRIGAEPKKPILYKGYYIRGFEFEKVIRDIIDLVGKVENTEYDPGIELPRNLIFTSGGDIQESRANLLSRLVEQSKNNIQQYDYQLKVLSGRVGSQLVEIDTLANVLDTIIYIGKNQNANLNLEKDFFKNKQNITRELADKAKTFTKELLKKSFGKELLSNKKNNT